jgi:formyltetrahydrofolate deformylase
MATATLLLSCPDQKGLVATMAEWVYRHDGNIVHADQHTDASESVFFQRIEFELDGFDLDRAEIVPALSPLLERFAMRCDVRFSDERPKVAVLVSKQAHCMYDLLARWRMGELEAEIPLVISNHPDHVDVAAHFDVEFAHLAVTPESRIEQESAMLALLAEHDIDLVVLARYMQVLSAGFVAKYPNRIINIHHSFLPAFAGGRPYHQAHDRGVKLIGVTAHYATAELDEGPIIEQDVARVTHRDSVEDLVRKGRDLEMIVLARAVRAHLAHRVLVYGRKTVVF